jgi:hypothetical protein
MNNLKEIALGLHNHSDSSGQLPRADGDLSWRVHILPHIEQNGLHAQFDLDQPWDAAANRKHADVRIPQYLSAVDPPEFTQTRYRVFVGPGTIFEPGNPPVSLRRVADGTNNTILVIEASEAVPWPQPRELPFTPNGPLPAVGHPDRNVVLVAMADGSVKTVAKDRMDATLLRALITPAGKERVPDNW